MDMCLSCQLNANEILVLKEGKVLNYDYEGKENAITAEHLRNGEVWNKELGDAAIKKLTEDIRKASAYKEV